MAKRHRAGWRMTLVAGCVAGLAALSPLIAAAEEDRPCPSGSVIEVGGVSNHHSRGRHKHCGEEDVDEGGQRVARATQGQDRLSNTGGTVPSTSAAGVQEPRLVLPNTGGGPVEDQTTVPLQAIFAGAIALGTGGYLGLRRSRNHVRG